MVTNESTAVDAASLHTASQQAISRAVQEMFPDSRVVLGPQCPSVTSYVCRVTVDDEEVIAKYSWLGLSLVSVLRGAGGTWEDVQAAQAEYVRSENLLTAREGRSLAALRQLGRLRVCETAGVHGGVLLTRLAPGEPLADVLAARPGETGALLDAVLRELKTLHRPTGAQRLREVAPIAERSIHGVFRRKFNGPASAAYLRDLGRDSELLEYERQEVIELVQNAVQRLLRMSDSLSPWRGTAVFGDLKPEHVFLDGRLLTFIDPAVQWASGPQPDVAKLTGRALLIALNHPQQKAGQQIADGVASTLTRHVAGMSEQERALRLREVMILWLMDTVSILTTCLSAPAGLPLAPHQEALVSQAEKVARVVDRVSALLVGSRTGLRLLDAVFSEVEHMAGRIV